MLNIISAMDTVAKLSVYTREKGLDVKVVGIPKTIKIFSSLDIL